MPSFCLNGIIITVSPQIWLASLLSMLTESPLVRNPVIIEKLSAGVGKWTYMTVKKEKVRRAVVIVPGGCRDIGPIAGSRPFCCYYRPEHGGTVVCSGRLTRRIILFAHYDCTCHYLLDFAVGNDKTAFKRPGTLFSGCKVRHILLGRDVVRLAVLQKRSAVPARRI